MSVPIHYLTWGTYGTWLPGDPRGWTSRKTRTPEAPTAALERYCATLLRRPAVVLTVEQRVICAAAIEAACVFCGWALVALNVRTTHGHALLGAEAPPRRVLQVVKTQATRALRGRGLAGPDEPVWARGGSTRLVGDAEDGRGLVAYILDRQGENVPGAVRSAGGLPFAATDAPPGH